MEKFEINSEIQEFESHAPQAFLCPITREVMKDPYVDDNGISYERKAIYQWVQKKGTHPTAGRQMRIQQLKPNRILKEAIEIYKSQYKDRAKTMRQLNQKNRILQQQIQKLRQIGQKFPDKEKSDIRKVSITPDTTTYAWKYNVYKRDNANKNICICPLNNLSNQWLCSAQDLPSDGEYVFTIKALRISKRKQWLFFGKEGSVITIGVMDSQKKWEGYWGTQNHSVYLSLYDQNIGRPIREQKGYEVMACSCQPSLSSVPCLIECHVNRNKNTITWRYNGKNQAESKMPRSWKDGRNLCAVLHFNTQNDCVQFI